MKRNPTLMPSLAIAGVGVIWGLYWIPIRALDEGGIPPSWTSLITFSIVGIVSLIALATQRVQTRRLHWSIILTGLMTGICVVFYAVALIMTEVVKVVLLFYLTPVWSTILGRILLRERITPFRLAAVVMGLTGLVVILGIESGIPKISNLGDFLALLSGLLWSYATVRVRRDPEAKVWEPGLCFLYWWSDSIRDICSLADLRIEQPSKHGSNSAVDGLAHNLHNRIPAIHVLAVLGCAAVESSTGWHIADDRNCIRSCISLTAVRRTVWLDPCNRRGTYHRSGGNRRIRSSGWNNIRQRLNC